MRNEMPVSPCSREEARTDVVNTRRNMTCQQFPPHVLNNAPLSLARHSLLDLCRYGERLLKCLELVPVMKSWDDSQKVDLDNPAARGRMILHCLI